MIEYSWKPGTNKPPPLLSYTLIDASNWTLFTINAIIKVENYELQNKLRFSVGTGSAKLKGVGSSTFYIKYLHP